jgi:hypothetical protein
MKGFCVSFYCRLFSPFARLKADSINRLVWIEFMQSYLSDFFFSRREFLVIAELPLQL